MQKGLVDAWWPYKGLLLWDYINHKTISNIYGCFSTAYIFQIPEHMFMNSYILQL